MPFTFAHPAIVLPLNHFKKWFSVTGLVIGSMAPDFEYFFRMKVSGLYGHTTIGIFLFDLPVAIILSFLFHGIVRNALINNLPSLFQKRFGQFKDFNFYKHFKTHFVIVIISVLIGTASHIFWDSFTHPNGYFVKTIHFLNESFAILNFKIAYFKLLQHLSSLFGSVFISFLILRLPIMHETVERISFEYWLTVFGTTFSILVCRFIFLFAFHESGLATFFFAGNIIAATISAVLLGLLFAGALDSKRF